MHIHLDVFLERAGLHDLTDVYLTDGFICKDGTVIDLNHGAGRRPNHVVEMYETIYTDEFVYTQEDLFYYKTGINTNDEAEEYMQNLIKKHNLASDTYCGIFSKTPYGSLMYIITDVHSNHFLDLKSLSPIKTSEEFFSVDKVLLMHICKLDRKIDDVSDDILNDLKKKYKVICYNDMIYSIFIMGGSPQNLFLKVKNGVASENFAVIGEFDLTKAISGKCVFDISERYDTIKGKSCTFINSDEYIMDNFIVGKEQQNFNLITYI